jgi:hypothetical protein
MGNECAGNDAACGRGGAFRGQAVHLRQLGQRVRRIGCAASDRDRAAGPADRIQQDQGRCRALRALLRRQDGGADRAAGDGLRILAAASPGCRRQSLRGPSGDAQQDRSAGRQADAPQHPHRRHGGPLPVAARAAATDRHLECGLREPDRDADRAQGAGLRGLRHRGGAEQRPAQLPHELGQAARGWLQAKSHGGRRDRRAMHGPHAGLVARWGQPTTTT